MSGLAAAIAFLTRLPLRRRERPIVGAVTWFPLVGAGIGSFVAVVLAAAALVLPVLVAATVAVAAGVLLTGALHEDGLADTLDAIGSGESGPALVAVMRDPRLGAFGTAALAVSLIWRIGLLAELSGPEALQALPAVHALSRTAMVAVMWGSSSATGEGLAASHLAELEPGRALLSIGSGLALGAVLLGLPGAAVAAAAGLAALPFAIWARGRLGGVTGDVLGACQQGAEITGLTVLVALS